MQNGSDAEPVLVVGGGVIGAACAWYLRRFGRDVTLIERDEFGHGCSHGNCGYICPSHILPLNEPGAWREAVRSLYSRNAPLSVKPRLDVQVIRWFWKFSQHCNEQHLIDGGRAIQPLLDLSRKLYGELANDHHIACDWQEQGLFYVCRTQRAMEQLAQTDEFLREHFGTAAERLTAEELVEREPALKTGLAGGWYYSHDAHLRADLLMSSWQQRLSDDGVSIREHCALEGLERDGNRVTAARTPQGSIPAAQVVIATGAWTPHLASMLGYRVPIEPGKGYSLTMSRPEPCPQHPLIFPERRVAVTPMADRLRLGSIMEFAGYDTTIAPRRIEQLRTGAGEYLKQPVGETVLEEWYGWRPMTWDSLPLIGPAPGFDNVTLAAGHNMLGMSMATGTGLLVAQLLSGRPTEFDLTPYNPARMLP